MSQFSSMFQPEKYSKNHVGNVLWDTLYLTHPAISGYLRHYLRLPWITEYLGLCQDNYLRISKTTLKDNNIRISQTTASCYLRLTIFHNYMCLFQTIIDYVRQQSQTILRSYFRQIYQTILDKRGRFLVFKLAMDFWLSFFLFLVRLS